MSDLPSYPADAAARESVQTEREYASWGRRVGAYLLDTLVLVIVVVVIAAIIGLIVGLSSDDDDAIIGASVVVGYVAGILGPLLYFAYFHARSGQTPGKRWLGIRVVEETSGDLISFGRAFGRYAITILFSLIFIPLLLDYLWPLWDSKNQSLHDKVVSSVVVRA